MKLKFFADQCVPASVQNALREYGHQVIPLSQYLDIESPDSKVIQKAQRQAKNLPEEIELRFKTLLLHLQDLLCYQPQYQHWGIQPM